MKLDKAFRAVGLMALFAAGTAMAQNVPNTFQSGTPAQASEVNENFSALDQAVTDLQNDAPIRTVLVRPVPFNPAASGTALRDAISGMSGAAANNRYLVKIEPGDYDLGSEPLLVWPHIEIEGSGQGMTKLLVTVGDTGVGIVFSDSTGLRELTVNASIPGDNGTVLLFNPTTSSSVRNVTLFVTGASNSATGIRNQREGNLVLENVDVDVVGAGNFATGIRNDGGGSAEIRSVSSTVSGGTVINHGFYISTGNNLLTDVDATATGPSANSIIIASSATANIFNSRLNGGTYSIRVATGATAAVATSQLVGPLQDDTGMGLTVVGCYNGAFAPIADTL